MFYIIAKTSHSMFNTLFTVFLRSKYRRKSSMQLITISGFYSKFVLRIMASIALKAVGQATRYPAQQMMLYKITVTKNTNFSSPGFKRLSIVLLKFHNRSQIAKQYHAKIKH